MRETRSRGPAWDTLPASAGIVQPKLILRRIRPPAPARELELARQLGARNVSRVVFVISKTRKLATSRGGLS